MTEKILHKNKSLVEYSNANASIISGISVQPTLFCCFCFSCAILTTLTICLNDCWWNHVADFNFGKVKTSSLLFGEFIQPGAISAVYIQ